MEVHTLQGALFDLDGTLLDSTGVWAQIDAQILAQFGIDKPAGFSETVKSMSIAESSRYFVETFSLPCVPEEITRMAESMAKEAYEDNLPLKPHAVELLDFLDARHIPYGVVTATYGKLAEAALRRLQVWDRMAFLLTEEQVGAPKTDPRIFYEGASRLHLGRRQVLVAEDSLYCVQTAKAAGFFTVGVRDPSGEHEWAEMQKTATVTVEDLLDICTVF